MRGLTLALLGLALSVSTGLSATYYVSSNGSGTNCDQNNPCAFQTALDNAKTDGGSSTIIMKGGTYFGPFTYNKSGGDGTLTIQAQDPNNKPVLDGGTTNQILNINTSDTNVSDNGNTVTIKNLIFQKGNKSGDGGGGLYLKTRAANIVQDF